MLAGYTSHSWAGADSVEGKTGLAGGKRKGPDRYILGFITDAWELVVKFRYEGLTADGGPGMAALTGSALFASRTVKTGA